MGLSNRCFAALAAVLFFAGVSNAAPKLRLVTSTVGPLSVAPGGNGSTQIVEAFNAGDGALTLSLSSSAPGSALPWARRARVRLRRVPAFRCSLR